MFSLSLFLSKKLTDTKNDSIFLTFQSHFNFTGHHYSRDPALETGLQPTIVQSLSGTLVSFVCFDFHSKNNSFTAFRVTTGNNQLYQRCDRQSIPIHQALTDDVRPDGTVEI